MKTWLIPLALLCATGLAHADGMPGATPAAEAAAPAKAKAKAAKRKPARLPHGDLRHCLELGNNAAIIRCAEKPAKR